jgi:hypothetical protein
MTPLELLAHLETSGYRLRAKDGKLFGPPGLPEDMKSLVKEHKQTLVALVTHQCPVCNQPIKTNLDTPNVLYIECSHDPAHFGHHIPKIKGEPSYVTAGGVRPTVCVECSSPNDGPWKYCAACWLKFIEDDMQKTGTHGD